MSKAANWRKKALGFRMLPATLLPISEGVCSAKGSKVSGTVLVTSPLDVLGFALGPSCGFQRLARNLRLNARSASCFMTHAFATCLRVKGCVSRCTMGDGFLDDYLSGKSLRAVFASPSNYRFHGTKCVQKAEAYSVRNETNAEESRWLIVHGKLKKSAGGAFVSLR